MVCSVLSRMFLSHLNFERVLHETATGAILESFIKFRKAVNLQKEKKL